MEHYKTMTGRHLTLKQRNMIQEGLYNGLNFSQIAVFICKDPTTLSKEVRRYRKPWVSSFSKAVKFSVKCVHSYECRKNRLCRNRAYCKLEKYIYDATYADREYRRTLSESRKGCRTGEPGIEYRNDTLKKLSKKVLPIHTNTLESSL